MCRARHKGFRRHSGNKDVSGNIWEMIRATDLSQVESIIYFVLEWTHLDLANEFWLDFGVTKNSRQQLVEMRE